METLDIIVLGRKLEPYGVTPDYKNRLDKAVEVYRANLPTALYTNIIITGGIVGNNGTSQARAGLDYLRSMYFSHTQSLEEAIILEDHAKGTIGNAVYTKLILLSNGDRTPIIVTSDYHIKRVEFIFNYVYGQSIIPAFIDSNSNLEPDELRRVQVEEERKLSRDRIFFERNGIGIGEHEKILAIFNSNQ